VSFILYESDIKMTEVKVNSNLLPFIMVIIPLVFDGLPVTCCRCEFNPSFYSDPLAIEVLGEGLFNKLSGSVHNRKAEFLAGRTLAASMLSALSVGSVDVDMGIDRAPVWPEYVKGSISHADQIAICAICSEGIAKRIGIDIEPLINEASDELIETIVSKAEEQLANDHGIAKSAAFSLIFSAKESLFKALYPEVNYYFDFNAATITHIDTDQRSFEIKLNFDLSSTLKKDMVFTGCYQLMNAYVITLIVD
jgi:4'-phosphopantetheinyl transferase EntD